MSEVLTVADSEVEEYVKRVVATLNASKRSCFRNCSFEIAEFKHDDEWVVKATHKFHFNEISHLNLFCSSSGFSWYFNVRSSERLHYFPMSIEVINSMLRVASSVEVPS